MLVGVAFATQGVTIHTSSLERALRQIPFPTLPTAHSTDDEQATLSFFCQSLNIVEAQTPRPVSPLGPRLCYRCNPGIIVDLEALPASASLGTVVVVCTKFTIAHSPR